MLPQSVGVTDRVHAHADTTVCSLHPRSVLTPGFVLVYCTVQSTVVTSALPTTTDKEKKPLYVNHLRASSFFFLKKNIVTTTTGLGWKRGRKDPGHMTLM